MSDIFFLSRGVSPYAAGGVALVVPVTIVLGAVSSALGAGGASIISRALGAGDNEKAGHTAGNIFLFFFVVALLFTTLGLIFIDPLLNLLGTDEILMPYTRDYLVIILIGAVTSTGFSSLIRAEGNTKYSLYIWIFPVLINLIFDPIFIFVLGLGVKGAAIATVLAQITSYSMSVHYFFFRKDRVYKIKLKHFKLSRKTILEILAIGSPTFLSQISMSFFAIFINHLLYQSGGSDAIVAFGIVSRIQSFAIIPQNGIVQGLQPVVSYNYAAKNYPRISEVIMWGSIFSICYGLFMTILILLFGSTVVGIFVNDDILQLGTTILKILSLSYLVKGIPVIVSSVYQSMGKPITSVILLCIGILIVQLPLILILNELFGLNGIWYGFCISDFLIAISNAVFITVSYKKLLRGEIYDK